MNSFNSEVVEVNKKRGFVVIKVSNIYMEFKRLPNGKVRRTSRWKYPGDDDFVSKEEYVEVFKKAAAILKSPKKENKKNNLYRPRQTSIVF